MGFDLPLEPASGHSRNSSLWHIALALIFQPRRFSLDQSTDMKNLKEVIMKASKHVADSPAPLKPLSNYTKHRTKQSFLKMNLLSMCNVK